MRHLHRRTILGSNEILLHLSVLELFSIVSAYSQTAMWWEISIETYARPVS